MLLVIFNNFRWNKRSVKIKSTWWIVIILFLNVEPSKCWWRLQASDLSLQVDPCYYWRSQNSRLAWRCCLSKALVERWNSLLRVNLPMFQRWISLCVAILTNLLQQVTHRNQLSVLLGQHDFNKFYNLNRLILKKGGFTPVLANNKKGIFQWKRALLVESQRPVRRISNQVLSFRLETH